MRHRVEYKTLAVVVLVAVLGLTAFAAGCRLTAPPASVPSSGAERAGGDVKALRQKPPRPSSDTPTALRLITEFAGKEPGDWQKTGKVWAPRVLLAKLECRKDIEQVNRYLQSVEPWSSPGSSWLAHSGDYDFTEVTLTTILYRFGDRPDLLYPDTRCHIVDVLLLEEGGSPRRSVPGSLGMVGETENHVLMTESSRLLKNQWKRAHGHNEPRYDNETNGMRRWLLSYLGRIHREGFHEFNSVPYQAYATQALLNLETFAESPDMRRLARCILDQMAGHYALGSLGFRQVVPFRRQMRRAGSESLHLNYMNTIMSVWAARPDGGAALRIEENRIHAFTAAVMDYRPPTRTLGLVRGKDDEYFLRIGHGIDASPEIFSGGPGYLISAGGVCRGLLARVVARPTVLLLNDDAGTLQECFHLPAAGDWRKWNNTGVHRRFACAKGPVHIPQRYAPSWKGDNWQVFAPAALADYFVAVHSADNIGIIVLLEKADRSAHALGLQLQEANPDPKQLQRSLNWPSGGTITYDVRAPSDQWVIRMVDGKPLSRAYDKWPYPAAALEKPAAWIRSRADPDD